MAEKYLNYFDENCNEDKEDVLMICETANKQLYKEFKMSFNDPITKKPDPRLLASSFGKIYEAILISLEKFERTYSDFELNICGRLLIGYSTNQDEDDEKQGNFMIYIRHLNVNKKFDSVEDPSSTASERAVQWNNENIINQPEVIKNVSIEALDVLKGIDVVLNSSECVMPIFVTVYESIINYLKIVRREQDLFEYEINFMNCFFIGVRESEDGNDDVYIRPNIDSKLRLKNDSLASSKYE